MSKYSLAFLFTLVVVLLPQSVALADVGPKPTMEFEFRTDGLVLPDSVAPIVSGTLYECQDSDCSDARPLEELGPQRFECDGDSCFSMAYAYAPYHQLEIKFADGITRKSNIFTKTFFSTTYFVTISADDYLTVREKKAQQTFLPLLVTLIIELALAYFFTRYKKYPPQRFLLGILLVNLITQPLLMFTTIALQGIPLVFAIGEIMVCFFEAIFIYFFMKREIPFGRSLLLSLIFNFASLFIGLFLPI